VLRHITVSQLVLPFPSVCSTQYLRTLVRTGTFSSGVAASKPRSRCLKLQSKVHRKSRWLYHTPSHSLGLPPSILPRTLPSIQASKNSHEYVVAKSKYSLHMQYPEARFLSHHAIDHLFKGSSISSGTAKAPSRLPHAESIVSQREIRSSEDG
jgi:hypothetical protein